MKGLLLLSLLLLPVNVSAYPADKDKDHRGPTRIQEIETFPGIRQQWITSPNRRTVHCTQIETFPGIVNTYCD